MDATIGHLQINVRPAGLSFYRDFMSFLGWKVLDDGDAVLGVADSTGASLWFAAEAKEVANDYDGPGMNHIALHVEAQADVDATVGYLRQRNVPLLFETPRHRPEFASDPEQTYYQVMFESPDRVLLEVVYMGPKQA